MSNLNAGPGERSFDEPWDKPAPEDCPRCQGTGRMPYRGEGYAWCDDCNGSGLLQERKKDPTQVIARPTHRRQT